MERHPASAGSRQELGRLLEAVLTSRGQANAVFDILAVLQVNRAGGRGGQWESRRGRASPCRCLPVFSPRTPRRSRKECARAADSSVPCWSGKSCSWARCRAKTRPWQVGDLEGVGYSPLGSSGETPCQHRMHPRTRACHRPCDRSGRKTQSTHCGSGSELRSVSLPGIRESVNPCT